MMSVSMKPYVVHVISELYRLLRNNAVIEFEGVILGKYLDKNVSVGTLAENYGGRKIFGYEVDIIALKINRQRQSALCLRTFNLYCEQTYAYSSKCALYFTRRLRLRGKLYVKNKITAPFYISLFVSRR